MIFLSHNCKDKAVVEQVALRLKDIFGQDKVFYDSWSIQPGDGIIDKMNEGLGACRLFLFFVSKNSLQSNMVKLEWQNAVQKAAHGQAKLVPVKLDDVFMPPILSQNLYIDLFNQGLEVALRQIVDVSEGRNTFAPGPQQFSNLRTYVYQEGVSTVVECHAEHYLEPISHFMFLVDNEESEVVCSMKSSNAYQSGFSPGMCLDNGASHNAYIMAIERGTAPGFPFVVTMRPTTGSNLRLVGVMHEKSAGNWSSIPMMAGRKAA